ncbi:hypothetical protein M0G74_15030 [Microbulbifer sp. CAU 1566]|nr:hypothetical protein [Microbulbifer sp. CAU 1566]
MFSLALRVDKSCFSRAQKSCPPKAAIKMQANEITGKREQRVPGTAAGFYLKEGSLAACAEMQGQRRINITRWFF